MTQTTGDNIYDVFNAAATGDAAMVARFVDARSDAFSLRNEGGHGLLHVAAFKGQTETVRLLLDRHADVDGKTDLGHLTPLVLAAMNAHVDTVKLLLERGADINVRGEKDRENLFSAIDRHGTDKTMGDKIRAWKADIDAGNKRREAERQAEAFHAGSEKPVRTMRLRLKTSSSFR
jgi:ankyrin repeat protein